MVSISPEIDLQERSRSRPKVFIDDPGVVLEHIKTTVRAELQVDRPGQTGRERLDFLGMVRVKGVDPALDEIGKEVPAVEPGREPRGNRSRAEGTARDRGNGIGVDRSRRIVCRGWPDDRDAIRSYTPLANRSISVFAQGSYRNRTNVRADSDVDICVLSRAAFFPDYGHVSGVTNQNQRFTDASYTFPDLKRDVEAALKAHFGAQAISRGDKAFDVKENTSRIAADVVPTFEGRLYYRDSYGGLQFHSGTVLQCAGSGTLIYNWPEQHFANGVTRHEQTQRQFKKKARCLKSLRCETGDGSYGNAKAMSSFLLESLISTAQIPYSSNRPILKICRLRSFICGTLPKMTHVNASWWK